MRQKQAIERKPGVRKAENKEPLTETIQKERRSSNFFKKMADKKLISYAKKIIEKKRIKNRGGLYQTDLGLYNALRKRNLLDAVIPEKRVCRDWSSMPDNELITFAKNFLKERNIKNRANLQEMDRGIYAVLRRRKLLDTVLQSAVRVWSSMKHEELVDFAKKFVDDNKIKSRQDLHKTDPGLYSAVYKRKLLDKVVSEKIIRNWSSKSDTELIKFTKAFIKENEIQHRKHLSKIDSGLLGVLRERKLLDTVFPNKKRRKPPGFFTEMSNSELVSYTKKLIEEKGIKNISALQKIEGRLCVILRKRNLLNSFFPHKKKVVDWASLSNEEVIRFAKNFIAEKKIKNRGELGKANSGLIQILRKRNLLDAVIPEKLRRDWVSIADNELMQHAKKFIEEKGIGGRTELQKADTGLYIALIQRRLLDKLITARRKQNGARDWISIPDEELILFAKEFIQKNKIKNRCGLEKHDNGLYTVLRKRKLLDAVIPDKLKHRNWVSLSDDEVIDFAKKFIEKNGIKYRREFYKADSGLYVVLVKRGLLDAILPVQKRTVSWSSMPDEQLIQYAKNLIKEKNIRNINTLTEVNRNLCNILRRRKLLKVIFPGESKKRHFAFFTKMDNDKLLEFAKNFMQENQIHHRGILKKKDAGLYKILRKRNLLSILIPDKQKRRDWPSDNAELIKIAKIFIKEKEVKLRHHLKEKDTGLYEILRKRNLLSAVFSDIEEAKKTEAVKQVVDAMKEFGGSE